MSSNEILTFCKIYFQLSFPNIVFQSQDLNILWKNQKNEIKTLSGLFSHDPVQLETVCVTPDMRTPRHRRSGCGCGAAMREEGQLREEEQRKQPYKLSPTVYDHLPLTFYFSQCRSGQNGKIQYCTSRDTNVDFLRVTTLKGSLRMRSNYESEEAFELFM